MPDEFAELTTRPKYDASLRLECDATARVTAINGTVLFDIRDDGGAPASASLTRAEACEIASMLYAADRNFW